MEIKIEENATLKRVKPHFKSICAKVGTLFDKFDKERATQKNDINAIRTAIYRNTDVQKASWHSKIALPDIYELAQTLKAHVVDCVYSNPEAMFDVSVSANADGELALAHKAVLVRAFEKMNFKNEIEKIVDSIVETGEATLFVGWQRAYKQYRRPKTLEEQLTSADEKLFTKCNKLVFDGAKVTTINALDFVFDRQRRNNWESCPKIFRKWLDVQDILSDKTCNLLSGADIEEIKNLYKAKSAADNEFERNGQVEVLEFWGDFALEDGTILKNYLITVVGRRFVARCEENPYISTPFVHASIIEDPITARGLSPLRAAITLSELSSEVLNKQIDALSLIVNPPYLAPKGAFKGEQAVSPGKIVEYDASLLPQTPVPLNFERALCGWDFIKYFKSGIESATGVFKTMAGEIGPTARTATELNYSAGGQSARLNLIIEGISRKIILPTVEKVAETIANFKIAKEPVVIVKNGAEKLVEVDFNGCEADFTYRYGDRKAILEKKSRFNELFQVITAFMKVPELAGQVNWLECFRFALEQYGIENADNFLKGGNND